MKYKYKAWLRKIEKVEIIKETEKMVIINGAFGQRREAKRSGTHQYHDTFQDAKDFLVSMTNEEVKRLKSRIAMKLDELERIKSLTNNEEV